MQILGLSKALSNLQQKTACLKTKKKSFCSHRMTKSLRHSSWVMDQLLFKQLN